MQDKKRKLVQITSVKNVKHLENSENLDIVSVLGWKVVTNKDQGIKKGDLVVYFAIDSLLPIKEKYEFLRASSYHTDYKGVEGFKLRTVKLRGQISQGLIMTLDNFKEEFAGLDLKEGDDVSKLLDVTQYFPKEESSNYGTVKSVFHPNISKTDELRVQEKPELLEKLKEVSKELGYYITEKIDGMSVTIVGEFGEDGEVDIKYYTRTSEIVKDKPSRIIRFFEENGYREELERFVRKNKQPIFFQGELYGEGIQKNKLGIKGWNFRYFNVGNPKTGEYYDFMNPEFQLPKIKYFKPVKIIEHGLEFKYTIEKLIQKAEGLVYENGKPAEGMVIRPKKEFTLDDGERLSFKVINNKFLLKNKE